MKDANGHAERIQRVVDYLAEHLDETLDLDALAHVACFSPYHFHRVYRGLLGETVNDTVRRLRLHRSAVDLLDREMDADHNRCVITLVGEREPIQEAAIRGVGKAAELIDLNVHQGAHPRMGAADVVPFIPIDGVTIEDCVAMARHVTQRG